MAGTYLSLGALTPFRQRVNVGGLVPIFPASSPSESSVSAFQRWSNCGNDMPESYALRTSPV
jgi:hypothetical protein